MAVLNTVGIEMPDGFPTAVVWRAHERATGALGSDNPAWREFGGGWNGTAYRFVDCSNHSAAFTASFREDGPAPVPPKRYEQEAALFGFFVAGLSSIEGFVYGMHALAWGTGQGEFAMATDDARRQVSVRLAAERFAQAFPDDDITRELAALRGDPQFTEWSEVRNILTHRAAPGRMIDLQLGGPNDGTRSANWQAFRLDDRFTDQRLTWLIARLAALIGCAETFVAKRLP